MPLSKNEIKFIRSLQQKKFRDEESLFIVEGIKLVAELLSSETNQVHDIYYTEDWQGAAPYLEHGIQVSQAELDRISGLKSPNQVLAIAKQFGESEINYSGKGLTLVLDMINDPGNLGTIIRTADWFGIQQVICSEGSVELYNPKVVQASMGAIFRTKVHYANLGEVLAKFKDSGIKVYGAEMTGSNAFEEGVATDSVLLMGSESHGISTELNGLFEPITIPKFGESESLNVGMAAGILMAEWAKQF